jgi:hypothetical protein
LSSDGDPNIVEEFTAGVYRPCRVAQGYAVRLHSLPIGSQDILILQA